MKWRMREFDSQRLLGICVLSILCMILLSPTPSVAQVELDDLTGVTVAVYNGSGEMVSSRIALVRMFEWMGATVVEVDASQILDDFLDDCDMIVFPGGSESSYMIDLQYSTGIEKIRDFVENGGSYFGICGGSTFGANAVNLFNGFMYPANEPGDLIHMTTMNISQSSTGPYLSDHSPSITTMYYGSQYFKPGIGTDVHVVAAYNHNRQAGMIAFEYGSGTVFLSSPHPEYEEDSDRIAIEMVQHLVMNLRILIQSGTFSLEFQSGLSNLPLSNQRVQPRLLQPRLLQPQLLQPQLLQPQLLQLPLLPRTLLHLLPTQPFPTLLMCL